MLRLFWSDPDGNPAPDNATFSFISFSGKKIQSNHTRIQALPAPVQAPILKKTFLPEKNSWDQAVEKALSAISLKDLQKVVLARSCILDLAFAPDPFAITAALREKAKGAYVFCVEIEGGAFLGASPERLFKREGNLVISDAIAGTRKRGANEREDAFFANALLQSAKDIKEHAPVEKYLQKALSPLFSTPVSTSPRTVLKTPNVQHLFSKCSGSLKNGKTDADILECLHPTPALCGLPKDKAYSFIQNAEPFERGLYGGAIGWSNKDASEWVVGIRSCLLIGKRAILFSGTGIVDGSTADAEWDELNQKLKLYDGIFNH